MRLKTDKLHNAAAVFVGSCVDFDLVAGVDESRNLNDVACGQLGRFHDFAGSIAFDSRFGVNNFTNQDCREFDGDGAAVVKNNFASCRLQDI